MITVDIVEAVRAELGELRARVDLVGRARSLGHFAARPTRGEENAGQDLAKLDGVDALFLGHQHLLLPGEDFVGLPGVDAEAGTIRGKPVVMADFWGSHLGIIDLWLEMGTRWQVVEARIEVRPIARRDANGRAIAAAESDASVLEAAKTAHEATVRHIRTPIGRLTKPLRNDFALIGDSAIVQLVNNSSARLCRAPGGGARGSRLAAHAFSSGAIQVRRPQRHRHWTTRDQGRSGHLPVPQQSAGR